MRQQPRHPAAGTRVVAVRPQDPTAAIQAPSVPRLVVPGSQGNAGIMDGFARPDHVHGMGPIVSGGGLTKYRLEMAYTGPPIVVTPTTGIRIPFDTVVDDPLGLWDGTHFIWPLPVAGAWIIYVAATCYTTSGPAIIEVGTDGGGGANTGAMDIPTGAQVESCSLVFPVDGVSYFAGAISNVGALGGNPFTLQTAMMRVILLGAS